MRILFKKINLLILIILIPENGMCSQKDYGYIDSYENNVVWLSAQAEYVFGGVFLMSLEKNIDNKTYLKKHLVPMHFNVKNAYLGAFKGKSLTVDVSSDILPYMNSNSNRGSVKKIQYELWMSLMTERFSLKDELKLDSSKKSEYSRRIEGLEKDIREINVENFSGSGIEEFGFETKTIIRHGSECVIFLRAVGDQKKLELVDPVKGVLCGADAISVTKEFYEARRK